MSNPELKTDISSSTDCPLYPGRPVLERIALKPAEIGPGFTIRRALALVACMRKLLTILNAMLRDQSMWNAAKHLQSTKTA